MEWGQRVSKSRPKLSKHAKQRLLERFNMKSSAIFMNAVEKDSVFIGYDENGNALRKLKFNGENINFIVGEEISWVHVIKTFMPSSYMYTSGRQLEFNLNEKPKLKNGDVAFYIQENKLLKNQLKLIKEKRFEDKKILIELNNYKGQFVKQTFFRSLKDFLYLRKNGSIRGIKSDA